MKITFYRFFGERLYLTMYIIFLALRMLVKKYFFTINHKRLGLYYFYFALLTSFSGSILATGIRIEMALPGSPLFNGDSLRYLQVITAHALIMIFFVVVPIFFGGFANYLLPYHVGSKDVAFPRLNSMGFWLQPCGYLLIAKIGFFRTDFWYVQDRLVSYFYMQTQASYQQLYENTENLLNNSDLNLGGSLLRSGVYNLFNFKERFIFEFNLSNYFTKFGGLKNRNNNVLYKQWLGGNDFFQNKIAFLSGTVDFNTLFFFFLTKLSPSRVTNMSWRTDFWRQFFFHPYSFWALTWNATTMKAKRRKRFFIKCPNALQTVSGWTFITPFSSKTRFTGVGVQDMLILGVYFAGISTTISLVNLLATRRCLASSGLRNRRILLPFISISILLMFRALAVITPVLGSAMLMLALDRHWATSFFDFAYGGDPIFFHHLFWFFGHPEVYVLVIPAFGVINSVLPTLNYRRVASKHHLIWAVYIMNYMGFLVWGHHMYLIGLDHRSRSLYSTITIMISLPATIKVVNWTFSLMGGFLKKGVLLLGTLSFIFFFLVAGFTGMWLSHVSLNVSMHDTLYVVAHFHLMLSGAVLMGIFVGFYFYFWNIFGLKFSRTYAYFHITYYTAGQWATFIPLFWVSFSGLPRRLHDYPAIYIGWQSLATAGHMVTMVGVFYFYALIVESYFESRTCVLFSTIIARFLKRVLYYLHKSIYLSWWLRQLKILPKKPIRKQFIYNNDLTLSLA